MKIFAIPYAGATAKVFLPLKEKIEKKNNFIALDLPGHGSLCDKECINSIFSMSKYIYEQIVDEIEEEDYCLLGYCMGSWVNIELYYLLKKNGKRLPQTMFFLAANLKHLQVEQIRYQNMSKEELIKTLEMTNQLPLEIVKNKEVLEFVLPIIRNDLVAVENYSINRKREQIAVQGSILFSREEKTAIQNWNIIFKKTCNYYQIDGKHLLLEESSIEVADIINRELAALAAHKKGDILWNV